MSVQNGELMAQYEYFGVLRQRVHLVDAGGLEPETVEVVERLQLLDADPFLLLPARVTRRKNIGFAILIASALGRQGMTPKLVVAGPPGPHNQANAAYLKALRRLVGPKGAKGSVLFLHDCLLDEKGRPIPVNDRMMADLFRLADGLLFPSRMEGFGIPMLEAGLSGLPIFRSDIPALREAAPQVAVSFALDMPAEAVATDIREALRRDPRYALRRRVRSDYRWPDVCRKHLLPLIDSAAAN